MADERLTKDITDDFFPALCKAAAELSTEDSIVNPRDMMCVMKSESDVRSTAHNDNPKSLPPEQRYNASGLIQFMPQTLKNLGWRQGHAAFRQMTPTQQMWWVKKYYEPYKGHLHTIGGLYVATFLPALISHADNRDYVLTAKGGQLSWAYGPNAGFDANKDFKITVGELEDMVTKSCKGARWEQLDARLAGYLKSLEPETQPEAVAVVEEQPEIDVELTNSADFECK